MALRKPVATANWKMEMTIEDSLAYVERFQATASDLLYRVDVILCPPFTALYPMAEVLADSPIQLGVQNVSVATGGAYTGEVSAQLAADAGARWVQLGHWEQRRHLGETDKTVNRKVHRALEAGLGLILLVGEERDVAPEQGGPVLERQLAGILEGCSARQVARMIFVYEPERTIGVAEPTPPDHVESGCRFVRGWLAKHFGGDSAQAARLVYGGSVAPAYAQGLLALPNLDGLGAGRAGRDPYAFAELVHFIAQGRSSGG
jgi:triosephosphate isomerase